MKQSYFIISMLSLGLLGSCKKDTAITDQSSSFTQERNIAATTFYALGADNTLDKFNTDEPGQVVNTAIIAGLQSMEKIMSIDFRPSTGELYGISNQSRLYIIHPENGRTRMVGNGPVMPQINGIAGFDFNPTVDRLRIVSSDGTNLRINPENGVVIVDGNINGFGNAEIAGSAYINNIAGAATTALYDIDVNSDKLFKQNPPNSGMLEEIGPLGINIEGEGGFDISPGGIALGLFKENKKSVLFAVDLTSGKAKKLEKFNKDTEYIGLAIPTNAVAYATSGKNLVIFDPFSEMPEVNKTITGLQMGEMIVGMDFRPLNGQIFAITNNSALYTINASSGAATLVASLSVPLTGTSFGMDFNPVVDRIRIVSNSGQNLRVNPVTGVAITDGNINPESPMISAAAYANNFSGTTTTKLYVLDAEMSKLYVQNPPNAGTLSFVADMNITASSSNGFDIGSFSNKAYAVLSSGGMNTLYSIDLQNGMKQPLRTISSSNGFTIGLGF